MWGIPLDLGNGTPVFPANPNDSFSRIVSPGRNALHLPEDGPVSCTLLGNRSASPRSPLGDGPVVVLPDRVVPVDVTLSALTDDALVDLDP